MVELSDADILGRLTTFEDAFVERKSTNDAGDVLKTAVAFANSTPIGYPAILFYGVTDKGEPEGKASLERLQRTISDKLADAYPTIYYLTKVFEKDGKQFLAVIIPGSETRPHFAGQSYRREGSKTVEASQEHFERMIAERNSSVREILKWKGSQITFVFPSFTYYVSGEPRTSAQETCSAYVNDCNQYFVRLQVHRYDRTIPMAFPLSKIDVSFDAEGAGRLRLVLKDMNF